MTLYNNGWWITLFVCTGRGWNQNCIQNGMTMLNILLTQILWLYVLSNFPLPSIWKRKKKKCVFPSFQDCCLYTAKGKKKPALILIEHPWLVFEMWFNILTEFANFLPFFFFVHFSRWDLIFLLYLLISCLDYFLLLSAVCPQSFLNVLRFLIIL